VESFKPENLNWFNKDFKSEKVLGASVEKAYNTLLKDITVKDTIIVAVIDGGVDIRHSELTGNIWVNKDEIPGNNIDDDNNGYVDDINGWNFIGNKSGYNICYENYEYTRIIKHRNDTIEMYGKAQELYEKGLKEHREDSIMIGHFEQAYRKAKAIIYDNTGIDVKGLEDIKKIDPVNKQVATAKKFLYYRYSNGFTDKLLEQIKDRNAADIKYYLNVNYDPRSLIGDNTENLEDRNYGNNNVIGPRSSHGTSVSGVIASLRDNNTGINGIAKAVKIMPVRVVPDGDERDKDIALAIMYAVDNGARIINMSFGKPVSPNKEFVDRAIEYAQKHNVLLVHAAGNEAFNIDEIVTYPSDILGDGADATNMIKVGASGLHPDKTLAADFSNYGKNHVDIFAPGVNIVSLDSCNTYDMSDGTSLAAPVVTGVAAVILSCYPELTPQQLIEVLLQGAQKVKKTVLKPSEDESKEKVAFSELSKSGGIVNLYNSLLIARDRYSKNQHLQ
jgi:subtilisin family serine protease